MFDERLLRRFAIRFVILLTLLLAPWPGFRGVIRCAFQTECRLLIRMSLTGKVAFVEDNDDPKHVSVDTKISLADRATIRPDGSALFDVIVLDSRSLGWMPNAMLLALLGATPLPLPNRRRTFVLGFIAINCYVALTIGVSVIHRLSIAEPAGWQKWLTASAYGLLVKQLWLSFVIPGLIWIACLLFGFDLKKKNRLSQPD